MELLTKKDFDSLTAQEKKIIGLLYEEKTLENVKELMELEEDYLNGVIKTIKKKLKVHSVAGVKLQAQKYKEILPEN